jgi:hypothetical protein
MLSLTTAIIHPCGNWVVFTRERDSTLAAESLRFSRSLFWALRQPKPAPKGMPFGIPLSLRWLSRSAPFSLNEKENV